MQAQAEAFRDAAPLTRRAGAPRSSSTGCGPSEWRILVGDDAILLDAMVREDPDDAYEPGFMDRVRGRGALDFTAS